MIRGLFVVTAYLLFVVGASLAQSSSILQRFEQYDKDHDGRVTLKETDNARWFERLDRNKDGVITKSEIQPLAGRSIVNVSKDEIRTAHDLSYGNHSAQKLDIYFDSSRMSAPVMLYIHGGGWKIGDKRGVHQKDDVFVNQGWVFISVNYRLLPDGKHPRNVEDIASAINWTVNNIGQYGGDPGQIYLMGHSAGCHLVSLVATDERYLKAHNLTTDIIKGVIANDTQAYDVTKLVDSERPSSLYSSVFGTDISKQQDASPLHQIEIGKKHPPFLILYSMGISRRRPNKDRPIIAQEFRNALREAGSIAEIYDGSKLTHGEINQRIGTPDDPTTKAIFHFLNRIRTENNDQK